MPTPPHRVNLTACPLDQSFNFGCIFLPICSPQSFQNTPFLRSQGSYTFSGPSMKKIISLPPHYLMTTTFPKKSPLQKCPAGNLPPSCTSDHIDQERISTKYAIHASPPLQY